MFKNIFENIWGWNPQNIEEHSASAQNVDVFIKKNVIEKK